MIKGRGDNCPDDFNANQLDTDGDGIVNLTLRYTGLF